MDKKKALILSYTFPPAPGIGGRRWAKFAKYLIKDHNCDIFILTSRNQTQTSSEWTKDINLYKQNIFYFKNAYPSIINKTNYSFFDKVKYRMALLKLKLQDKGNYFDKTILLGTSLNKQVENIIKTHSITSIIVTAGPFRWLSLVIQLKNQFPNVRFIADFRDPWTNNKTSFGYSSLYPKRLAYEQDLEKKVIENYDKIISVSDDMNNYFATIAPNAKKEKFSNIHNGFDTDDFSNETMAKAPNEKLRFIFTGTLYNKTEYLIQELSSALEKIKNIDRTLYNDIRFDFYGDIPEHLKLYFKNLDIISFNGSIPLKEVYRQIKMSHICMLFLTEDLGYSLSTKFYEYISQQKSILVFSKNSVTGDYVTNNKLGYSANPEDIETEIKNIYTDWKKNKLVFNSEFDISQFDVKNISTSVFNILQH